MHLRLVFFLTFLVAALVPATSIKIPFSSLVKNEAGKIISRVEDDVRRLQLHPKNPFSYLSHVNADIMPKPRVRTSLSNSFNWTSCGPAYPIFEIKTLKVGPSPLIFPGVVTFSFDFFLHDNIDPKDNITVAVTLKYLTGSTWLKIPCLGGHVGSCTFYDICTRLSKVSCPSDISKLGLHCKCPFTKGEYKSQPYSVDVDAEVFIAGEYTAMIDMAYTNGKPVGCYKIAFNIQ